MAKAIPISGGKVALVDDSDYEYLSKFWWTVRNICGRSYAHRRVSKSRLIYMHRVIMGLDHGGIVDHINGDGLDNRRGNLRIVTQRQNVINRRKTNGKTSKYKGVHWFKTRNKWRASITSNYKEKHLGYFTNEIDAAMAYDAAAKRIFGEYARTNEMIGIYAER